MPNVDKELKENILTFAQGDLRKINTIHNFD